LNKLLVGTLLAFASVSSYADDLKVADDFKSGDLVSADTFNQIFGTLEQINRTVIDADLVGVWSCAVSEHSANTASTVSGWSQKGLIWELTGAQINMTASSGSNSKEAAYTISTGAPSPLYTTSSGASTGTYVLFEGMMFVKIGDSTATHTYEVDIVSNDRITLKGNAELGPPQPTFLVCDSAEAVPASPTSPSVILDGDNKRLIIAWTDASNDETGFKVYRKLSSETEYSLLTTLVGENSYADPNVNENLTAYYQITAYNEKGESAKSKTVSGFSDYTAPEVTTVYPANNSTVPKSGFSLGPAPFKLPVMLTFSEAVELTLANCNPCLPFTLEKNGTAGSNGVEYGFAPPSEGVLLNSYLVNVNYEAGSTFVITLGKAYVKDASGNYLQNDFSVTFTTP
jgi:hypothetical protein